MSEETTEQTQAEGTDVSMILCRVIDVNSAIQNSFTRFIDSETKTLDDLALLLREEMSKIELFAPNAATEQQQQ